MNFQKTGFKILATKVKANNQVVYSITGVLIQTKVSADFEQFMSRRSLLN